jgi:anti-anti-sigma factor
MVITIKHEQGRVPVTVLAISGSIDVETVAEFQKTAEKAYQAGTRDLLLDLSEVNYINSSRLRVLHSILKC